MFCRCYLIVWKYRAERSVTTKIYRVSVCGREMHQVFTYDIDWMSFQCECSAGYCGKLACFISNAQFDKVQVLLSKTLTGQEQHPLQLQERLDLRAHTSCSECSKHSRDHETLYNHCMCWQWRELQQWYHLKLCRIHIEVDCNQVLKLFTWALAIGHYALIPSYYTRSQALPAWLHASDEKLGGAWEQGYHHTARR